MRIALLAKNKVGFIDGSCLFEDTIAALQPQWERCNGLVLSWILNSVSQELSTGIIFASNVALVWSDLKERFDKVDESRIYFLHWEIDTHVQGTSSISVYHTRLRFLWDKYDAIAPLAPCTCESIKTNVENLKQQRLFQFLMRLNEPYSIVCSQILLMKPLPSVNQAYSLLIQEEGQLHNAEKVSLVSDSIALYSGTSNQPVQSKKHFNESCDYCHIKGHKKETCYKLIGYPADFKFTKTKGTSANSAVIIDTGSNSVSAGSVSSSCSQVPVFTLKQYQQILELLGKRSRVQASAHTAGPLQWKDEGDW
ncbi:hypothetical protein V6Z11_A12G125200 [Gossypium hirsutum]